MSLRRIVLLAAVAMAVGVALGIAADEVVTPAMIASAEKMFGLEFTDAERDSMRGDLDGYLENYATIHAQDIPNSVAPAFVFNPLPAGFVFPDQKDGFVPAKHKAPKMPKKSEDLAFYSVGDLAELVRTRKVTSTELTKMYIDRLKRFGPELECVITLTEDLALKQAAQADAEIAAGHYRGPLHGIPYGAKDLLAVPGYKTTWGAAPYKDQMLDQTATVVRKLDEAGAVLVAKLTLGALAWGDVWYGGKTRNPWNLEQGSSGSSAGSASATSAGLVAFAIGTETWGSIVSPSTRCGTTGLRPTFGRVSRAGAMALSWTMDKIGPICRTVEDCALVFNVIRGSDGLDASVIDAPFNYNADVDYAKLKVGYVPEMFEEDYRWKDFDNAALDVIRKMGAELIPIKLPDEGLGGLPLILTAEAAAAFDDLTRSNRDDEMVRQIKNAWPNTFRAAQLIPAVEYIQANRVRSRLIAAMDKLDVDIYITPSFGGSNLLLTNLTGQPCVVLPNGFAEDGTPTSITFMGRLFGEGKLLAFARKYQEETGFHLKHPKRYM